MAGVRIKPPDASLPASTVTGINRQKDRNRPNRRASSPFEFTDNLIPYLVM
jgi:hypothetical protein